MTDDRSLERAARAFIEVGPTQAPDRAVKAALLRIRATTQERDLWVPRRLLFMNGASRLVAAAIAVVAVAGVVYVLRPVGDQVGQSTPSPSATAPSSTVVPRPTFSFPPLPTPSPRIEGTVPLREGKAVELGPTYMTLKFTPEFTLQGVSGWTLGAEHPDAAWFNQDPRVTPSDHAPQIQLLVPLMVLDRGWPYPVPTEPLPKDLLGWLRARTDMTLGPATPITIGGATGTYVDGSLTTAAHLNPAQYENVICAASDPSCSLLQYAVGMGADRPFRVIVLDVHGQTVVIGLNTAGPAADFSVFDDFLNGLHWQGES